MNDSYVVADRYRCDQAVIDTAHDPCDLCEFAQRDPPMSALPRLVFKEKAANHTLSWVSGQKSCSSDPVAGVFLPG